MQGNWHQRGGNYQGDVVSTGLLLVNPDVDESFARQGGTADEGGTENSDSEFGKKNHLVAPADTQGLKPRSILRSNAALKRRSSTVVHAVTALHSFVRAVGVNPDANVFVMASNRHQSYVSGSGECPDRGFDIELVVASVGNERLSDIPRDGHIDIFLASSINDVDNQLAVFLRNSDIVAGFLHRDKLAFRRGLQSVEDHLHVDIISGEVPNTNFAIVQLAMIDGRNYFLGKREWYVDANQLVRSGITDPHMQIAFRGCGPKSRCGQKQCERQKSSFHTRSFFCGLEVIPRWTRYPIQVELRTGRWESSMREQTDECIRLYTVFGTPERVTHRSIRTGRDARLPTCFDRSSCYYPGSGHGQIQPQTSRAARAARVGGAG